MDWLIECGIVLVAIFPMILLPNCCPCCVPCGGGDTGIETDCCPNTVPEVLTISFSNGSGVNCSCVDGEEIEITYGTDVSTRWTNFSASLCGSGADIELWCESGTWYLNLGRIVCIDTYSPPDTEQCSPFELTFHIVDASACICDGEFDVTITA